MPYMPIWCENHFPRPDVNPCCFLSIRKSTKVFQIFNSILLTVFFVVTVWWVFSHTTHFRYMRRIRRDNATNNDCEKAILEYLNEMYYEAVTEPNIEAHERFGTSTTHITSVLRLRGLILTAATISFFSYGMSSLVIVATFRKPERSRRHAIRIGIFYLGLSILGVIFSLTMATLLWVPVHSCVFEAHRIPILVLVLLFSLPYKILEVAVTIQYLRILRIFIFDEEVRLGTDIMGDEPGWLVAWWRDRNLPRDYKIKIKALRENDKLLQRQKTMKQMDMDNDEYRKRNRALLKRARDAERINWEERIGKYRKVLPNPDRDGDDKSGIFTVDSSVTWGTNLTRSMSRSSPDSALSVEDYMDNYEDYYGFMNKQQGGRGSVEDLPLTARQPSVFTFNHPTMKPNKVGPQNKNQNMAGSVTSIKSTMEESFVSIASVNKSRSAISIHRGKSETKKKMSLLPAASSISINIKTQNPTSSHSILADSESQNSIKPSKAKPKKQKAKSAKKTMKPNKVGPQNKNQNMAGSVTSIKSTSEKKESFVSIASVNKSRSAISIHRGKSETKKKMSLLPAASSISINSKTQNPTSSHSILADPESQNSIKPSKAKPKQKVKSAKKKPKSDHNIDILSDSEIAEEAKRPKIVNGKQPKVMIGKKKKK